MSNPKFDYTSGEFIYDIGGGSYMNSDGDILIGSNGTAIDLDTGDLHIIDSSFDDEDD